MLPSIDEIVSTFELLDDWEDRYRYVIELGREMDPLPDEARTEGNKVPGCASQVWLDTRFVPHPGGPALAIRGDSDAHIVRGLVALIVSLYRDKSPDEALATDPHRLFAELGLTEHLTPQRSNGVRSMVERIRRDARAATASA